MATLYIAEYAAVGSAVAASQLQAAMEPPIAEQTVSLSGSSAASSAFAAGTMYVRIHTDVICSIMFGTSPTATVSKKRMAADQTEYFAVPIGVSYKVAGITNT